MDPITLALTLTGLVLGGLGTWFTYLSYKRSGHRTVGVKLPDPVGPSLMGLCGRFLAYFWQYPTRGPNQASWAVKESAVLRGDLKYARENPGLGTAIVSTELALEVFGNAAQSRIIGCIAWALAHADSHPPRLLQVELFDPVTSAITTRPDFRHSLAFGIVLARSGQLPSQLEQYLSLVFTTQNDQGGWPPGEGVTIAELFTVTYAFELLSLCALSPHFSEQVREECNERRTRAGKWLIGSVKPNGLWDSGVLKECAWDELVSTAWVLHRVMRFDNAVPELLDCIRTAGQVMVDKSIKTESWRGTTELQRFRAEARVGAAAATLLQGQVLDGLAAQLVSFYLRDWRERAVRFGAVMPEEELDLSTVLFCLDGLMTRKEMRELSEREALVSTGG